jgi:hypothetical protein
VYSNGNREWLDLRQYSFVLLEGQLPLRGRRRASLDKVDTNDAVATESMNQDEIKQEDLTPVKVPSDESTEDHFAKAGTNI